MKSTPPGNDNYSYRIKGMIRSRIGRNTLTTSQLGRGKIEVMKRVYVQRRTELRGLNDACRDWDNARQERLYVDISRQRTLAS